MQINRKWKCTVDQYKILKKNFSKSKPMVKVDRNANKLKMDMRSFISQSYPDFDKKTIG